MVRGVNRSVIEVNDTGNKYFERVLFFVNPEYSCSSEGKLQKAANDYIKNADAHALRRKDKKKSGKKRLVTATVIGSLCAVAVALAILFL